MRHLEADFRGSRAHMRIFRSEIRADSKADLRPERLDFKIERVNFGPDKAKTASI